MSGESQQIGPVDGAHDTHGAPAEGIPGDLESLRCQLDANINPVSLLATDYLNHFNEVVMLIGLISDMPDCLEEAREWAPKTYQAHFMDSGLSYKEQAVQAYEMAPETYREPFDKIVKRMEKVVTKSLEELDAAQGAGEHERAAHIAMQSSKDLQRLIDAASALINGSLATIGQRDVDGMFDDQAQIG